MREKRRRLRTSRILAMLLVFALMATSIDFTVLAAAGEEKNMLENINNESIPDESKPEVQAANEEVTSTEANDQVSLPETSDPGSPKIVPAIERAELVAPPDRIDYMSSPEVIEQDLDFTGMEIKLTYTDGTEYILHDGESLPDGTGYWSYDFNWSEPGEYKVTFYCSEDVTVLIPIRLVSAQEYVMSLENLTEDISAVITSSSDKLYRDYQFTPDSSGIYMFRMSREEGYLESHYRLITAEGNLLFEAWSPAISYELEAGKTYMISINGESDGRTASITVHKSKRVKALQVLDAQAPFNYLIKQFWSGLVLTGRKIELTYEDDTTEVVEWGNALEDGSQLSVVDNIDYDTPGSYEITIYYGESPENISTSIQVNLLSEEDYAGLFPQLKAGGQQEITLTKGTNEFLISPEEDGEYIFSIKGTGEALNNLGHIWLSDLYKEEVASDRVWLDNETRVFAKLKAGNKYLIEIYSRSDFNLSVDILKAKEVMSVELLTKPDKTEYPAIMPDQVFSDGLTVKVVYDSGEEEIISVNEPAKDGRTLGADYNSVDFTVPGEYQVNVLFGHKSTAFTIRVLSVEDYLKAFETLAEGEEQTLNLSKGIKEYVFTPLYSGEYVFRLDNQGKFQVQMDVLKLTGDFVWGYDYPDGDYLYKTVSLVAGERYILRFECFEDKQLSFSALPAKGVESLEIITEPYKTNYMVSRDWQEIQMAGMSVKAHYSNGSEEILTPYQPAEDFRCLQTNFGNVDTSQPGEYQVEVSFGGRQVYYTVNVLSSEDYIQGLDYLTLETETALHIPTGGKEYTFTAPLSGEYCLEIQDSTNLFQVYNSFEVKDIRGNSIIGQVDYDQGKDKIWVSVEAGKTYIISFTNLDEMELTFSSKRAQEIKSLEVLKNPYKTTYMQGDMRSLEYEGMLIKIVYDDGSDESIGAGDTTKDGRRLLQEDGDVDFSKPGIYTAHVLLGGKSAEVPISIVTQEEYISLLEKITVGETNVFDIKVGIQEYVVEASETGTYMFKLKGFENTRLDDMQFDIQDMNGYSQTFNESWGEERFIQSKLTKGEKYIFQVQSQSEGRVQVNSTLLKNVKKLEIVSQPDKVDYLVDELDEMNHYIAIDGMNILITYEDGTTESVHSGTSLKDGRWLSVSDGPEGWYNKPGTYPITVSFEDKEATFNIHVLTQQEYLSKLEILETDTDKLLETGGRSRKKLFRFTPVEEGTYFLRAESMSKSISYMEYVNTEIRKLDGENIEFQHITYQNGALGTVAELKKNETYIIEIDYSIYHYRGLKINLSRDQDVSELKILTMPFRTEYVEGTYSAGSIGNGLQAEVVYKDGSKELLKWGTANLNGRMLKVDSSKINWNQPGEYNVKVSFGGKAVEFPVTIISKEAYYSSAEQWNKEEMKFSQSSGEVNKIRFTAEKDGYYRLKVDTLGSGPAVFTIVDDTYNRITYSINDMGNWSIGNYEMEYNAKLEGGKQYYILISNENDLVSKLCTLSIEKLQEVQSIIVDTSNVDLSFVTGTSASPQYGEISVEAVYKDGRKERLSRSEWTVVGGYDSQVPGTYPQKIKAYGKEADFNIIVVNPVDYENVEIIKLNSLVSFNDADNPVVYKKLHKFIPSESGKYYLNLQAADYGSVVLLTPDGDCIQTFYSSDNYLNGGSTEVYLTGGYTYYLEAATNYVNSMQYMITKSDLQIINLDGDYITYTGNEYRPSFRVMLDGKELAVSEYTVSYGKNMDAGIGYANIRVNDLPGVKSYFVIASKALEEWSVSNVAAQTYTGREICPKPIVTSNGKVLTEGTDYNLVYLNNKEPGTAQFSVIGINNYRGLVKKTFDIKEGGSIQYILNDGVNNVENPAIYGDAGLILKDPSRSCYAFTGWYTDAKLTNKITTIPGSPKKNYIVYAGWKKITVGTTSVSSISGSGSNALKVAFKAVPEAKGYEISYATNGAFTGVVTTVTTQTSASITGLKAGTNYYVRVRAYKTDSTGDKVYGNYSTSAIYKTDPPAPAAPAAVTSLIAVSAGKNSVKLAWHASKGAEGYLIYTQKNGKYGYCGMTTKGLTYTDTNALDSAYNFYWVYPYVKDSKGNRVVGKCTKYVFAKGITPAVKDLKATNQKCSVRLSWLASPGAEGYLIYGKTSTGVYGYRGMTTKATVYIDKNASKQEYNFYWVYPYHLDKTGKRIIGGKAQYVYGKAK